ncbi:hypothetical protein [Parvibaculum sp.]|jgi:hypothetical protein|uniref:hypothetical protein n=1 Tax=Parvibaculum sp. TaxID=2024848 RepID=UPI001B139522|nr:hypothetical protein [Parvibaculum sp.]MBO6633204.1 hypothetical protein [Parvibaculum sp.]MBO6677113.1 hypothetical protein [Parvibaculum sp.]MBO6683927.1 hypothetical protein [Parvibaculum sp.]MBO6904301.1 hypothetical protein [Parvibaculum sp.]
MTARDFARLLIKLMGLFILAMTLVQATQAISYLPGYLNQTSLFSVLAIYFVPLLASALIGWFLFKSDRLIADKVLFTGEGNDSAGSLHFGKAEEILLSALGIYLTAYGLIGLTRTLGYVMSSTPEHPVISSETLWHTFLIPSVAQVLVGLLIFLSSRGLVVLRHRFLDLRDKTRELGVDK